MAMNNMDDRVTEDSRDALRSFCAVGFRSDIDATALVLGRPPGEIRKMLDGEMPVDDDLEMKIRGIAQERNFKL
ncbi:MAG TPA: hypothetical protein VJ781_00155 [Pyrinomonadaceae bacterium]|nr:hypothetical protein [Pyrinomonadaceae bacterium]